ncbi:NAD(P)H-dependent oxidoreductase, partial [Escherichia coli]|nr:NAD(P)H-dependent oxidoreductase [Escherichia coli]
MTPEWHGMATPALKNFLLLTTANELAHKPALLVSVSVSINGVYPISELRMTGSKNNHVCFLPDHLIVRKSDKLIDQDANSD